MMLAQATEHGPRILVWCATHQEVAWEYDDSSVGCMMDLLLEQHTTEHAIEAINVQSLPMSMRSGILLS